MKYLGVISLLPVAYGATILTASDGDTIPNEWVAVLKNDVVTIQDTGSSIASILGPESVGDHLEVGDFKAISLTAGRDGLDSILHLDSIAYIEPNYVVSTAMPTGELAVRDPAEVELDGRDEGTIEARGTVLQNPSTWGLARISRRKPHVAGYRYNTAAGAGSFAYIIDTGVQTTHPQFGGRAKFGASFIPGQTEDGNGHGTHVAGTVGSAFYGVAKKVQLISVKVLGDDGSGSVAGVIQGIEWAVNDAQQNKRVKKSVANLSLGGGDSQALRDAARAAVDAGLFLAVAAGNSGLPASTSSPGNEPSVCTVGASDINDARAYFSNYGPLIDVFAPGVDVRSTYPYNTNALLSGTSQATPHVAGLAAYLLSFEAWRAPRLMCKHIQDLSTKHVITNSLSANNHMIYNGIA